MLVSDLSAKIGVPKTTGRMLPRSGVAKVIEAAAPEKTVCIVAPYGCGKTLAVASWLRERDRRAAWLNLDERDNAEQVFLDNLTVAITTLVFEQTQGTQFLADERYRDDPRGFLLETASRPINDGHDKILVLDNFTCIHDAGLQRFIRDFIAACLGEWTVIIISREELPPVFNDLMLRGRTCLITLNELNFTPAEIEEYFSINNHTATGQDILRIQEATEGWPAALNVVLAVSRDGRLTYGETARNYVRGFFISEIWEKLDEGLKDFMLKTSILEKLTPSSCHAVTGIGATLPTIMRLFQNGMFISKLSEKDEYQYHRVFHDFLRGELEASDIDAKQLYRNYAWWLFERDEYEQAFSFFLKAGEMYGVRRALKMLKLTDLGIEGFLERVGCITELTPDELRPYPEIVAMMAIVHYLRGEVAKMQVLNRTLLEWLEPGQLPVSPEEYAEYRWEVGWLCYLDPAENFNDSTHIEHSSYRNYVPHLKELHISRFEVLSLPSVFRGIRDYGNDYIFSFGDFLRSVEQEENHLTIEEEVLWTTYLILAEYEYELEHFAEAEEIVRRIMPLVEDRRYTYLYFTCTNLLVKLARAAGNIGEIDSLTARLKAMIVSNGHRFLLPNFHAFEMRNRLAEGLTGFTDIFMEENGIFEDRPRIYLLYRQITFARGLLSGGGYSEAIIMLSNLALMCEKYRRPTDLIEIDILKAIAYCKLEQEDAARRHLTEALQAAKRYGYIRIFADDAEDIWPVLSLMRRQPGDKYTQSVMISCKKELARAGQKAKVQRTELTKTELKILKYLRTGMSYEEIAHDNGIRVSTVKSHAHSVYLKLDVSNRTAAVVEAKRLGLLE